MAKINEDEHLVGQNKDDDKIGDAALAAMQKSLDDIAKLNSPENKEQANSAEESSIPIEASNESDLEPIDKHEDDVVDEVEIKKERHTTKDNKYRKLQNDKHRLRLEKEEALRKVEQLEHLLNESVNSSAYHYGKSALSDLERAKQKVKNTFETGDQNGFIDASIELTEAVTAVNELNKWAAEDKKRVDSKALREAQYESNMITPELAYELTYDWLDTHSYLQPNSRDYNSDLANRVNGFVNKLDYNLRKNNKTELIYTEDYFDTIDDFIHENMNQRQVKNQRSSISGSHIGGVRHGHTPSVNGGGTNPNNISLDLTADEKEWCINGGISESTLIKRKLQYAKEGK